VLVNRSNVYIADAVASDNKKTYAVFIDIHKKQEYILKYGNISEDTAKAILDEVVADKKFCAAGYHYLYFQTYESGELRIPFYCD